MVDFYRRYCNAKLRLKGSYAKAHATYVNCFTLVFERILESKSVRDLWGSWPSDLIAFFGHLKVALKLFTFRVFCKAPGVQIYNTG